MSASPTITCQHHQEKILLPFPLVVKERKGCGKQRGLDYNHGQVKDKYVNFFYPKLCAKECQHHQARALAVKGSKGCGNWGGLDYNHRQALLKNPLPPPPCQPSTADMLTVALSHCVTTNNNNHGHTVNCHTVSQQTTPTEAILSHTMTVSQQKTTTDNTTSTADMLSVALSHRVTTTNTHS